jgi:hypothetical protein
MSDLFSSPSFFFAGANPNVPQDLRQKLALALLMQKRKAPSTFGEGLSAIGDAIGDRSVMRQIEGEAAGAEQAGQAAYEKITGGAAPQLPPQQTMASPPPVQAASIASPSIPDPRDQTPVPPTAQEGAPSRGMLMRPNIAMPAPALPPAMPAAPLPPDQQQDYTPGAPMRMPQQAAVDDWRAQNPMQPGAAPPPAGGRPTVADFGQKPILAPTPAPVMAEGGDDPRRAIALAMLKQGQPGQPQQSAFAPAERSAAPPPAAPPIQKAPPTLQLSQAPPSPSADPGYVTPARPERAPPPTMTKQMQDIRNIIQNTPASQRETVAKRLQPLYDQETAKLSHAHEMWKSELTQDRTLAVEREKQLADQAKRIADVDKTRHDIAVGKIIQSEGRIFRAQDDGSVKDITPGQSGDGPPQIKMTQDQSDTLKFYKMGLTAASQLEGKERLLAEGLKDELAGKVPFVGNKLMNSQYRAAKNAAGLLVQADLRDTSGATIGTQEFKDRFDLLVPRPGDDEMAMRNKAEARRAVLEGQRLALGTARPMADYVDKEHAKGRAEKMSTLNREMEGKDKGKTYEKNGVFRKWSGTAWEEY